MYTQKLRNVLEKFGAWDTFKKQIYSQYKVPISRHLADNFGAEQLSASDILFQAIDWHKGGMYDFWADIHKQLRKHKL